MKNIWLLFASILCIYAAPVYAHGGPVFAIMLILIWGMIPLLVISVVVIPLSLLFGRIFHWKRKPVIASGIAVTVLSYLLSLPNMPAIIKWVVDLQYVFS